MALVEVIHPVEIGRDEDCGRRALLDLFGENGAAGVGDCHLVAGFGFPAGGDGVQRVLEAGGGEDRDGRVGARRMRSHGHAKKKGRQSGEKAARHADSRIAKRYVY